MPPGGLQDRKGEKRRDGGKIKWKLSEVDTRAMSTGQKPKPNLFVP